jgi:hypothetical protein
MPSPGVTEIGTSTRVPVAPTAVSGRLRVAAPTRADPKTAAPTTRQVARRFVFVIYLETFRDAATIARKFWWSWVAAAVSVPLAADG